MAKYQQGKAIETEVESKKGIALTKSGYFSSGMICSNDIEITMEQKEALSAFEPSQRRDELAKMEE